MKGSLSVQKPLFVSSIGSSLKGLEVRCGDFQDVVDIALGGCLPLMRSLERFVLIAEDLIKFPRPNKTPGSLGRESKECIMKIVMNVLPCSLRCLALDDLVEGAVEHLAGVLQLLPALQELHLPYMEIKTESVADSLGLALQLHGRNLRVLHLYMTNPDDRNQDFLSRILRLHEGDLEEGFLASLHTLILPRLTPNSWVLFGKVSAVKVIGMASALYLIRQAQALTKHSD